MLTSSEERDIAITCITFADIGFGLTRELCANTCVTMISQSPSLTKSQRRIGGRDS